MKVWLVEWRTPRIGEWSLDPLFLPTLTRAAQRKAIRHAVASGDTLQPTDFRPAPYLRVEPAPRKKKVRKK